MTLLRPSGELEERRRLARGTLAPLAHGLLDELGPLLASGPTVPTQKALLSRAGGRCAVDGTLLEYDPFDPRHRCPRCGREYRGDEYDRFRLYWHHLWLAERALHAALLGNLLGLEPCDALATAVLEQYADQYLEYPNRDNVLGPSRPFFSTYLESIWLLQLVLALDLLEAAPAAAPNLASLGARVRERLVVPSLELIAGFDEGSSNRQVWNNAALLAAGRMLGRQDLVERAAFGPSGLLIHLERALLADGSWYEGENYHLFAHRGLWYAVLLAEQGGVSLPRALASRFMDGFAAPFRTLLPDLTFPSRRDSQYAISVRQLRFAESCELGLARGDDRRLSAMLARLYDGTVPRTPTGRAASSADAERNLPPTSLTRADLSWRSLLVARESLPPLVPAAMRSDLLPAQGIAILRRDDGRTYAALDYGHSGGGHGHPDRLNLLLVRDGVRWFDDPGTGSYVDPSLHWYRSTLAHTAPLVDGRSQRRVNGSLLAFDVQPHAAWSCAEAELAAGLRVRRSLVLLDGYLVDRVEWESDHPHEVALPLHSVDLVDDDGRPLARTTVPITGGDGLEDGFSFLEDTARLNEPRPSIAKARSVGNATAHGAELRGWLHVEPPAEWWSATTPDVPTRSARIPMVLPRARARRGVMIGVWSWDDRVAEVIVAGTTLEVGLRDGGRDVHTVVDEGWKRDRHTASGEMAPLILRGRVAPGSAPLEPEGATPPDTAALPLPFTRRLGEPHYRRSEQSWDEADRPAATVTIVLQAGRRLDVTVVVEPSFRLFVPPGTVNVLDNEPAAVNGDGLQLYVVCGGHEGGWLLVPRRDAPAVDVLPIAGWDDQLPLEASWRPTDRGYEIDARVHLPAGADTVRLDLVVNETAPGRARRRGQLVLSGAEGEFVYLRGDRHDRHQLLRFAIPDV